MKEKNIQGPPALPSVEETKLGNILDDLTDEVQEVKNSIKSISQRYRTDLTSQLEHSYKFETNLHKNFKKINKKSRKLYHNSEALNNSLNKKLDQLKNYNELEELSLNISDSIFGIAETISKIELILPYNERLGVKDSPHRAHYPHLYKLLNPNHDDNATIREQDADAELSSFEQLDVQGSTEESVDVDEADESSNADDTEDVDDEQEDGQDEQEEPLELRSLEGEDVRSDTVQPVIFEVEEDVKDGESVDENEEYDGRKSKVREDNNDNEEEQKQELRELSPETKKVSENTEIHNLETKESNDSDKQQELENVIESYKTTKAIKQTQSLRSLRPMRSSFSISSPSLSSAGTVSATTTTSGSDDFMNSTHAQGTIVGSNGSNVADNLKKFMR